MPVPEGLPIQPFLNTLKFEKRYSPHTLKAYEEDLIQFGDYLITDFGEADLCSISSSMVRSWLASLKDAGLSARSINRKISSLSLFKYQLLSGTLEKTPMVNVRSPKIPKKLPAYVQQTDMSTPAELPDGFTGLTHKLLLAILYATGIRLSELVNLKETDIDEHTRTVKVFGKGKKERIIPVSSDLVNEVRVYCAEKRALGANCDSKYLLVNDAGRKLYNQYVYRAVKRYLAQITTQQKRSPHVLRHTFATHLANNGAELNAVKELLGHASLAATQVYTHNSISKLKEIHDKAHPKS